MAEIKVLPIQNKNVQPVIKHNTPIETSLGVLHQHKITAHQQPKNTNAQNSTLLGENVNQPLAQMLNDPFSAMQYTVVWQTLKELLHVPDSGLNAFASSHFALFNAIHVSPENLMAEMQHQNQDTTLMQGSLFDLIRSALPHAKGEHKESLLKLVVMLNTLQQHPFIIASLNNQFSALLRSLDDAQKSQFEFLLAQINLNDSNDSIVKHINALLRLSEKVFTNESTQLLMRMVHYNASRLFHEPSKTDVITMIAALFQLNPEAASRLLESQLTHALTVQSQSQVLQTLIAMFTGEATVPSESSFNDVATKLVRVMLSSPSHVLPLMHFILPLKWQNLEFFSECWVALDPHNHENPTDSMHILLSLHVHHQTMEIEIKGSQQRLNIIAFGNQVTLPWLIALENPLRHHLSTTSYMLESFGVIKRDKVRSIAEVFVEFEDTFKGINEYV